MVAIQNEKIASCFEEMKVIFITHHKELCTYPDKMPLDPDYSKYFLAEKNGTLQVVTARLDGELVGYYVGFISSPLHYQQTKCNHNDIFYVKKDKRLQGVGDMLFDFVLAENKRLGVQYWRVETKDFAPVHEFMVKKHFEKKGITYAMWIET